MIFKSKILQFLELLDKDRRCLQDKATNHWEVSEHLDFKEDIAGLRFVDKKSERRLLVRETEYGAIHLTMYFGSTENNDWFDTPEQAMDRMSELLFEEFTEAEKLAMKIEHQKKIIHDLEPTVNRETSRLDCERLTLHSLESQLEDLKS